MKLSNILILTSVSLGITALYSDANSQSNGRGLDSSIIEYGQKPPGLTPVRFLPDLIKTDHRIHSSPAFSPDAKEVYWSIFPRTSEIKHRFETILVSTKTDDSWSAAEVASFSGKYHDGGPFFSHDGRRLYFYSRRPIDKGSETETKSEIWFVVKQGEDWGEPQHLELDLDTEKIFFSMSDNRTIYFTSGHGPGGTGIGSVDIYCAEFVNGTYAKPERLAGLNSEQFSESDALISPDEKYLIFYSLERPDNYGQYDLYISYHNEKDYWTAPTNLGPEINKGYSRFPRFSPDGKYMFFVRPDGVYWIDASLISEGKN